MLFIGLRLHKICPGHHSVQSYFPCQQFYSIQIQIIDVSTSNHNVSLCWLYASCKKPGEVRTLSGLILLILAIHCKSKDYSITVATRPDPTVRPPSRIANVRPCSIATGWMSSIVISTLSPGMHISVPAGSSQTPVTSVVLK